MTDNTMHKRNHRRSIRLKGYDYSQNGLYFITICIQDNACLLGKVVDGEMELSEVGDMIRKQWMVLTDRFKGIKIDEFVVMPNHFHAIIDFSGTIRRGNPLWLPFDRGITEQGQPQGIAPTMCDQPAPTIGDVIGAFKSLSTNKYIQQVKMNYWPRFNKRLWQRNYYEHIIRNEDSHLKISQYIQDNPLKWQEDTYYV